MQAIAHTPIVSADLGSFASSAAEWRSTSPRRTFIGYTALATVIPLVTVHLISTATKMLPPAIEVAPFLL